MANSILEAVKIGLWGFPPHTVDYNELEASDAMPGTREKLDVLAEHLRCEVPIRHDERRFDCQEPADDQRRRRPRPR